MKSIVILTGSGISAESGLPTFRDDGDGDGDGLWCNHRIEDVATVEALVHKPDTLYAFYNARRRDLVGKGPNDAHLALAALERHFHGTVNIITQNIDPFHRTAGSKNVTHIHGELMSAACVACGVTIPWSGDLDYPSTCPSCGEQALRPNIVLFGEIPHFQYDVAKLISSSNYFITIGTSGAVYPAAGYAEIASRAGATLINVNTVLTYSSLFHSERIGKASVQVPMLVNDLLHGEI